MTRYDELVAIQSNLKARGLYHLTVDGLYGNGTRAAIMAGFRTGPRAPATKADFTAAGKALGVTGAEIRAVWLVEASGQPYGPDGAPIILFEPHRFWRNTGGNQPLSDWNYPKWDKSRYPKTQSLRYSQLLSAIGQAPYAGFASASYGGPQILGENYKAAGYTDPFLFAMGMAQGETMQILAMSSFVDNSGLAPALRKHDWAAFAKGYNGTGYRENKYDEKLAAAYSQAIKAGY